MMSCGAETEKKEKYTALSMDGLPTAAKVGWGAVPSCAPGSSSTRHLGGCRQPQTCSRHWQRRGRRTARGHSGRRAERGRHEGGTRAVSRGDNEAGQMGSPAHADLVGVKEDPRQRGALDAVRSAIYLLQSRQNSGAALRKKTASRRSVREGEKEKERKKKERKQRQLKNQKGVVPTTHLGSSCWPSVQPVDNRGKDGDGIKQPATAWKMATQGKASVSAAAGGMRASRRPRRT